MKKVVMRAGITGTRSGPGGTRVDWPPVGAILECDDAEAADLIGADLASTEADWAAYLSRQTAEHAQRERMRSSRGWV